MEPENNQRRILDEAASIFLNDWLEHRARCEACEQGFPCTLGSILRRTAKRFRDFADRHGGINGSGG